MEQQYTEAQVIDLIQQYKRHVYLNLPQELWAALDRFNDREQPGEEEQECLDCIARDRALEAAEDAISSAVSALESVNLDPDYHLAPRSNTVYLTRPNVVSINTKGVLL